MASELDEGRDVVKVAARGSLDWRTWMEVLERETKSEAEMVVVGQGGPSSTEPSSFLRPELHLYPPNI